MKKSFVWIMALSLSVLALSIGMLSLQNAQDRQSALSFDTMQDELQGLISAYAEEGAQTSPSPTAATSQAAKTLAYSALPETDDPVVLAYREMAQDQPDMIGWLRIEGTVIDYPVMRSPDEPERYLHLDFDGRYSRSGTLFMLPVSDPATPNENIIIYGHHMKDGSMFGQLPKYEDKAFYDAQPYIEFDTLYGQGRYKIIAIFRTSIGAENEFDYYHYEWLDDEATFDRYMRGVMANRLYDTGETAVYGDELLSLSTCDYHEADGRLVVVAKRVLLTEGEEDA